MRLAGLVFRGYGAGLALCVATLALMPAIAAEDSTPAVGIAVRDITPELPIRLAGYAGRKRPADKLDHPLVLQALALKNVSGERFVFVALDNCEVSHAFMQPVLQQIADQFQVGRGEVAVVSSHTHSAPVLERRWAERAGLGWIGKHTQLIHPGLGSYFFIGILMLNKEMEYDAPIRPKCGNCTR